MRNKELLPCPFCGGEVKIRLVGDEDIWWTITRGNDDATRCNCRLFMESEVFTCEEFATAKSIERQENLIARWNTRTNTIPVGNGKDYTVVNE